jgi:hypothetical protein
MSFKTAHRASTLAALQAAQIALEKHLKESAKVRAERVILRAGVTKGWPEGDVDEILYALGLKEWTK